jgi:hypothetical protein
MGQDPAFGAIKKSARAAEFVDFPLNVGWPCEQAPSVFATTVAGGGQLPSCFEEHCIHGACEDDKQNKVSLLERPTRVVMRLPDAVQGVNYLQLMQPEKHRDDPMVSVSAFPIRLPHGPRSNNALMIARELATIHGAAVSTEN